MHCGCRSLGGKSRNDSSDDKNDVQFNDVHPKHSHGTFYGRADSRHMLPFFLAGHGVATEVLPALLCQVIVVVIAVNRCNCWAELLFSWSNAVR